ncbi:hypothetical protein Hanom_Chr04g00375871 [Helianthus anomalus]
MVMIHCIPLCIPLPRLFHSFVYFITTYQMDPRVLKEPLSYAPDEFDQTHTHTLSIHKSYSAPTSLVLNHNGESGLTKTIIPETKAINILNWPEKALDITPKVLSSGAKLRRVLSLSSTARVSSVWLAPLDIGGGLKRVHHSSGDLGLLWAEHQEQTDLVDSLEDVSEQVLEEEDDFFRRWNRNGG